MAEMLDIDLDHERKQRREDALADARAEQETQIAIQKLQQSLSTQSQQQALQSQGGLQYDQQAIIAHADQVAQELSSLDLNTRRSRLDSLQGEDGVMYAVVRWRVEQLQQDQTAAAKAQG